VIYAEKKCFADIFPFQLNIFNNIGHYFCHIHVYDLLDRTYGLVYKRIMHACVCIIYTV